MHSQLENSQSQRRSHENKKKAALEHVPSIVGKLLAEGLEPQNFTVADAKELTKYCVAPKLIHQVIDLCAEEIQQGMYEMNFADA